ncbi:MAG: hypothetical protein AAB263_13010 [Planctomycetota bacterium]
MNSNPDDAVRSPSTSTTPAESPQDDNLQRVGYIDKLPALWMLHALARGKGPARAAMCLLYQGGVQHKRKWENPGADFTVSVSNSKFERWGIPKSNVPREVAKLHGLVKVVLPGKAATSAKQGMTAAKAKPTVYRVLVNHLWTEPKSSAKKTDAED